MKMKAAPSRGHIMSKDTEAMKGLVWGYGCWHVGEMQAAPYGQRVKYGGE